MLLAVAVPVCPLESSAVVAAQPAWGTVCLEMTAYVQRSATAILSQPASDLAQTGPSFAAELSPPLPACLQGECGNKVVSILFYVTFTLAVPMIMIQLFAAVVIENFEKQQEMEEWSLSPALLEVGLVCFQPGWQPQQA